MEKKRKQITIILILIAVLNYSCKRESTLMIKLTNNSCKFWHLKYVVRLKDNLKEKKDFQIFKFCKNSKLIEYEFEHNDFHQVLYTCWEPQHQWKFIAPNKLILNDEKFYIKNITRNRMVLFSKKRNIELFYFQTNLRPNNDKRLK